MAQLLSRLTTLLEDLKLYMSTMWGNSEPPVNPAARDHVTSGISEGICMYVASTPAGTHTRK